MGFTGPGSFTQSGGTFTSNGYLYLGYNSALGTYNLSGGQLLVDYPEYVGFQGPGAFTQSGGTNTVGILGGQLYLGRASGANGTYNLSGGQLLAPYEYAGSYGTGTIGQSGGTNTIAGSLILADTTGSCGFYNLSGSGQLSAASEYIGWDPANNYDYGSSPFGLGSFQQNGGMNTVLLLSIGASGRYVLGGGTLQINGGLVNQGAFSGGSGPAALISNGVVDLSSGVNLGNLSVNMGSNSLLIVPSGFNPSTGFAGFSSLGLTHTAGTTLVVAPGQGFGGSGTINDFANCQGSISASGGTLNLTGGLALSGTGAVNLGGGYLLTNGTASSVSGGSLFANQQDVGGGGTGIFTQTGGTISLSNPNVGLLLGADGTGTYLLNGGLLVAPWEFVGYLGGTGVFTQTGGTNVATFLVVGNSDAGGTYNLNGGVLRTESVEHGTLPGESGLGPVAFNVNGGTIQAINSALGISVPITLVASGGGSGATFDTAGYTITVGGRISGPGSLTKVGSGALVLTATNTYAGNTLVTAGTLALGSGLALQDSTLDTSGGGTLSFGTLFTATLGGLTGPGTLSLANTVSSAVALSVGNNNAGTTFTGALRGSGSLIKIGSGSLDLGGSNTYTGATTVSGGTLVLDFTQPVRRRTTSSTASAIPRPWPWATAPCWSWAVPAAATASSSTA